MRNYYLEQQNAFLQQELTVNQNSINKLLVISSSHFKNINYNKGRLKKSIDITKNAQIWKSRRPSFHGFSNRDNVRPPIQFRKEGQSHGLKR